MPYFSEAMIYNLLLELFCVNGQLSEQLGGQLSAVGSMRMKHEQELSLSMWV